MTATHLPLQQYHTNRQLFSDHYLNTVLPQRSDWKSLAYGSTVKSVMEKIIAIWKAYTPSSNEAQTEREFIRPVLEALGHTFEVQPSLETREGTKRPDYVLYRDQETVVAYKNKVLTDEMIQHTALAIADAKHWERPLDVALRKSNESDRFSNKNPSYQMDFYLRHSGVEWGILTNGKKWRLYHYESSKKLDRFYEVDVPELLKNGDRAGFMYFYAFFCRDAFDDQPLSLAAFRSESITIAQDISDNIKQQVYDALRHLAQGFLDYTSNQFPTDDTTLKNIYDHSLIVLYRLLFILYAEARDLLPIRVKELYYKYYSLNTIARDIVEILKQGDNLPSTSTIIWNRLHELFKVINEGNPSINVATFNGGLFDPQRYPFLEQYAIGDSRLLHAIDLLTRVDGEFVDYRDLAEQHLGTIYEGLLEHHLRAIDPEGFWTIDLFNDKGERKVTGSYYTPDFVVEYMVEETLGYVLAKAVENTPDDAAKIQAVLQTNVLDPSMGSGHFLVAATEYIARFLVDLDVSNGEIQGETDLGYWKRRVVQSCIYGVDLNPLAVDLAKLSLWIATVSKGKPLSFLDHHLRCGNALVGATLDNLQPSSIVVQKKPKRKKQSANGNGQNGQNGQISMLDDNGFRQSMSSAVDSMWLIEHKKGDTVDEVHEQEQLYEQLRAQLVHKYGRFTNIVTATFFGLDVEPSSWNALYDYATERALLVTDDIEELMQTVDGQATLLRFFHWELEFPEVFFDKQGQPRAEDAGFDVVIGNPPYVRQERLSLFKPYFQTQYRAYDGVADLYLYFYEQGIRLLNQQGRMAYISSGTFTRANFAKPFRTLFPKVAEIESVIDFGENQPFKGAEMVRPSIIVLRKGEHTSLFRSLFIAGTTIPLPLKEAIDSDGIDCDPEVLHKSEWIFQTPTASQLATKILDTGKKLGAVVKGRMYYGIKTGLNEAFIIDQATRDQIVQMDTKAEHIIKPMLRGEDLRPWYQENEGRYLIFTRRGINIDEYPSVKAHLEAFRERLEPKPNNGNGDNLQGRKPGAYQWYEIQDTVDYYDAFDETKIFWPAIGKLPRFSWGEKGVHINNSGHLIPTDDPSLLGILQSRVIWFAISQICTPLRLRAGLWQYQQFIQFIERLPIPDMTDEERETIGNLAIQITEKARMRYALDEEIRSRVIEDLGQSGEKLNQKLIAWWELDFPAFHEQIKKVFNREISLWDRTAWSRWLKESREQHLKYTRDIRELEKDLNTKVYALFDLNIAEIAFLEEHTKYEYGEV